MHYQRAVWAVVIVACVWGWALATPGTGEARDPSARVVLHSGKPFQVFTKDLLAAIRKNQMGVVCRTNAQAGAASRGVTVPGNQVLMLFRADYAVRMLKADVEAGFEAPLRVYVVEQPDGMAKVSYIKPSDVFAGYQNADLDTMAAELDAIFAAILRDAMQ